MSPPTQKTFFCMVVAITVAVAIAITPPPATATETIGVWEDPAGTICYLSNLSDEDFAVIAYYFVVHSSSEGVSGSRWKAELPACAINEAGTEGLQYANDYNISGFSLTGNSQTGIEADYGGCYTTPVLVVRIGCFTSESWVACCMWPVTPDPAEPSGRVTGKDCSGNTTFPTALVHPLVPDGTCPCGIVPVERTTWGGVKALYIED